MCIFPQRLSSLSSIGVPTPSPRPQVSRALQAWRSLAHRNARLAQLEAVGRAVHHRLLKRSVLAHWAVLVRATALARVRIVAVRCWHGRGAVLRAFVGWR